MLSSASGAGIENNADFVCSGYRTLGHQSNRQWSGCSSKTARRNGAGSSVQRKGFRLDCFLNVVRGLLFLIVVSVQAESDFTTGHATDGNDGIV
jgi:hypothetical protein